MSHTTKFQRASLVSPPRFRRDWSLSAKTRRRLGGCDAHLASLRESPIAPELQADLAQTASARTVAATLSLAGGTLTETQVASALAGRRLPPSRRHLGDEARNVVKAARLLLDHARAETPEPVSPALLLEVHRTLGQGLGAHFAGSPGTFRAPDEAARVPCPPARDVPGLVERLSSWAEHEPPVLGPHGAPTDESDSGGPLARAAAVHAYLAWIRPFADGNGRVARLVETYVLLRAGVPALAASLATVHYAQTRRTYERTLRQTVADRSLTSFVSYAVAGFRDGLAALARSLREHQWQAAWRAFVFARFDAHEHHKKTVKRRRRALALSLPLDRPVGPGDVAELDAELGRAYRALSERTLQRDMDALVEMGIATEREGSLLAAAEVLRVR